MKLTELDAYFFTIDADGQTLHRQESIDRAQGVMFEIPVPNAGYAMIHFSNPRGASTAPGQRTRWEMSGTGLHDLTITPSINYVGVWHGWVTKGEAV